MSRWIGCRITVSGQAVPRRQVVWSSSAMLPRRDPLPWAFAVVVCTTFSGRSR
ncbi:hypothetical protein LV79_002363 [Actinokineospora globicatena]|nr:hypothetical protein [Actinokineospora globicatena]